MGSFTETQNDPKCLLVESRIWENLVVKSGVMGFGIWKITQGFRNPTINCNPESKFHWQRLESSTWNPESRRGVQNPRLSWIPLLGAISYFKLKIAVPEYLQNGSSFLSSLIYIHPRPNTIHQFEKNFRENNFRYSLSVNPLVGLNLVLLEDFVF